MYQASNKGTKIAMRRPNTSFGGGSNGGNNRHREMFNNTQVTSYIDKEGSEYVNIKNLINHDKDNYERRKNSNSSRNHHISNTVHPQPAKYIQTPIYNNTQQEWQTGNSSQAIYRSNSSTGGLGPRAHQAPKMNPSATLHTF